MNSMPSSIEPSAWPRFGVMGGGAVGCFYGGLLARAGAPVTIVGRTAHVAAMQARGLRITSRTFDVSVPVQASIKPAALATCDIVLFATKGRDTDSVAIELAPHLDPAAIVLAFQNGVDGVDRLAARLSQQVYPAVIYVSCQMIGPGHVQHNGRGDVLIGERFLARPDSAMRRSRLEEIAACLRRAAIETTVADDVRAAMWTKLAMNCAYNALSALGRARYQRIATTGMPEAISSTGQDIAAGRLTEIDDLNGFVARRGRDLGIATPVIARRMALGSSAHADALRVRSRALDVDAVAGPRSHRRDRRGR